MQPPARSSIIIAPVSERRRWWLALGGMVLAMLIFGANFAVSRHAVLNGLTASNTQFLKADSAAFYGQLSYKLTPELLLANRATVRNLQESFGRDILHRLRHRKPIQRHLVKDILRMAPDTPLVAARGVAKALFSRLGR